MHLKKILTTLLPPSCCGCGKYNTLLCKQCLQHVDFAGQLSQNVVSNSECLAGWAASHYSYPIDKLLKELKFGGIKDHAKIAARLIQAVCSLPSSTTALVPIPLHASRQLTRGYDQAYDIARELSILTNIPMHGWLTRTKNTAAQAQLNSLQRQDNIKNAFQLNTAAKLNHQSIVLIDDVITTGSTVGACASLLRKSGCQKVYFAVVAHE